jgi:hypothetical protein
MTSRLTSACSGRTRVSRPVLKSSTGRATRRAADAQRWVDSEGLKGNTLEGGDNCYWGERHPRRAPSMASTCGVTGVWASVAKRNEHLPVAREPGNPAATSSVARAA